MKALVLHVLSMSDFKAFSEKASRRGRKIVNLPHRQRIRPGGYVNAWNIKGWKWQWMWDRAAQTVTW